MPPLHPYAILIVEDERIVAKDLQHMLRALGYDAFAIAASSDDAMQCASERRPDLALMDIRIQGSRDGIETAGLLRQQLGVPVVYLTAHSDDATLDRAKRTSPYGYLMKPITPAELRSAVEISIHRHQLERQLRERERWFATTLRSIDDAVITTDLAGTVAFVNPAAERLTGVAAEQAIGGPASRLVGLADPAQPASPLDEALQHRRSVAFDAARCEAAGGAHRVLSGSAAPVVDGDDLLGAVMVVRDVTEKTRIDRQLEIADRLASLGTLTSGVAHEINNPLAVVLANTSYLRSELDDLAAALDAPGAPEGGLAARLRELAEVHGEITAAGWRIGKIVADLKVFARPAESTSSTADLGRAIEWAVRATEHAFKHRARLVHDVAGLPRVVGDEARLGQVFVNLLMNAAQALAPAATDHEVAIRGRVDGERVIVEVRDDGPGIAPEELPRIFEPFFTTKAIGQGTGLGLSVCHGIVTSVGGEIQAESQLGSGTAFRVILRVAPPRPEVAPAASPAPAATPPRARILIVDDDAMVHRTIKRLLRDHDLVCTESGREALALVERGERFDLILSDLMMPIMTGIELHAELVARDPALARRVVFMTGGAVTTAEIEDFLRGAANPTLEKPFGVPEIRSLVARMLGGTGAAASAGSTPRAASGES